MSRRMQEKVRNDNHRDPSSDETKIRIVTDEKLAFVLYKRRAFAI